MLSQMYEDYCYNRLPCGICRLTNSQCPKCAVTTVNWCDGPDGGTGTTNHPNNNGTYSVTTATNLKDSKIPSVKYTTTLGDITTEVNS